MPPFQSDQTARRLPEWVLVSLVMVFLGPGTGDAWGVQEDTRPDLASGIDAWFIARDVVDEMHVPTTEQTQIDERSPEFSSVSVILRFRGQVIGVGDAHGLGRETLHRALGNAVNNARRSKRVRELPIQLLESIGRGTTIELELGGTPEPVLGETIQDVADNLRPGIDGLAIRRGDRWNYVFPGRMQAFGQADRPNRSLIRLMREAELPPRDPGELKRLEDIGFYRFQTLTLTQDAPTGSPFESIRGARRIVVQTEDELREVAQEIAVGCTNSIMSRLASDPEKLVGEVAEEKRLIALGLFGDYDFVQDDFDPLIGSPANQALAAWALARHALYNDALSPERRERLADLAHLVLERLGILDTVEDPPLADPIVPALVTLAALDIEAVERLLGIEYLKPEVCSQAKAQLIAQVRESDADAQTPGITLAFWSLAAHALQKHEQDTFEASTLEALDALAWSRHDSQNVVGSLPWLLLTQELLPPPRTEERWALTIEIVNALIANQIGHADSLVATRAPAEDLVGGFVISGASRTTATARSLRPALALAVVLRSPSGPVPPELEARWERARQRSARFIAQLQVDETQTPRAAVPKRALGGIKSAPWSNVTALGDTALGLLLATELIIDLGESPARSDEIDAQPQ